MHQIAETRKELNLLTPKPPSSSPYLAEANPPPRHEGLS